MRHPIKVTHTLRHSLIPIIIYICSLPLNVGAQTLTLDDCIERAMKHNIELQSAEKSVERARALQGTAWDMDKTELALVQSPSESGGPENALTLSQQMEFPTYYAARRRQLKAETQAERSRLDMLRSTVAADVASAYYQLAYERQRHALLSTQDSILQRYVTLAHKRYDSGETRRLEVLSAERQQKENAMTLAATATDVRTAERQLALLIGMTEGETDGLAQRITSAGYTPACLQSSSALPTPSTPQGFSYPQTPEGAWSAARLTAADKAIGTAKNAYAPSLSLTLKHQLVITAWDPYNINRSRFDGGNFMGFEFGVGVPLFYGATKAKVKAAKQERDILALEIKQKEQQRTQEYATALTRLQQARQKLEYYQKEGDPQAAEILRLATIEYEAGEISYIEYTNALQESVAIRLSAAEAANDYRQAQVQLTRLTGGLSIH